MASGLCAGTRPDAFALEGSTAEPVEPHPQPDDDLLDVADSCPALAITVLDEDDNEIGPRP
ncbi:ferredoxin [Herbihabitans rhizosphaerae]|uniref:Ferredoxin n=2 Tax=Herbihabitans rhizosphaerae TaxID=1872711 RepID=A0A4Q7L6K8_9PSEU|nr:ferredoxin [Herbihabitans rhizosphaerae]